MKRSHYSLLLIIFIIIASAYSHSHSHTKSATKSAKPSTHSHSHSHSHDHSHGHDHNHEHKHVGNNDELYAYYLGDIAKSKIIMMTIAVILVSIPSFPTFLVLLLFSKLAPKQKGGGQIIQERYLRMMICLAVGSLTGDVFFGMMDHILNVEDEGSSHSHSHTNEPHIGHNHTFRKEVLFIIIGIFFFYAFDRHFGVHQHSHDHDHGHGHSNNNSPTRVHSHEKSSAEDTEIRNRNQKAKSKSHEEVVTEEAVKDKIKKKIDRSAILFLMADFLHNFIDGIGIGVAFNINNTLGVSTTIAIAAHELPHEIGDFAILLKKNYGLTSILITQLSTATGAFFGGLVGIFFGNFAEGPLLGFTAGGFLYLAIGNMIPELVHAPNKSSIWELILEVSCGLLGTMLIIWSG